MDHFGVGAYAVAPGMFEDRYYWGRRPNGTYIPRYRNVTSREETFVRGYGYQGGSMRTGGWNAGTSRPGVGAEFKESLRNPGPWVVWLGGFGEMLPNPENRVTLHPTQKDRWGVPLAHIDCSYGPNEMKMAEVMAADGREMLAAAGYQVLPSSGPLNLNPPGDKIHEMGTARMGRDPATSVLNGNNAAHDVENLYVTDGACMASSACQNPSLTYMALTARAAHHAGARLKAGAL
jgi:choline dehydrogenase-like flavoprotein